MSVRAPNAFEIYALADDVQGGQVYAFGEKGGKG